MPALGATSRYVGELGKRLGFAVQCSKYHFWILKIGETENLLFPNAIKATPSVRLTEEKHVAGRSGLWTQGQLFAQPEVSPLHTRGLDIPF